MMKSTLQENLTKYQRVMEYMLVMVLLNAEMTLLRHRDISQVIATLESSRVEKGKEWNF